MTLRAAIRSVGATVLAATVFVGCLTGERPVLSEGPAPTGDPAADEVIARLAVANTSTFSATYTIATTQQPPSTADAVVVQDGPSQRSVTVADTRFIVAPNGSATCDLTTSECVESIDDSRVSDLLVNSSFYGAAQANRVRTDVGVRTGPTVASTETIAGQTATCVTVPVATTVSTYCALDDGVLARLQAADLVIELTSYTDSAEPSEFVIPPIG